MFVQENETIYSQQKFEKAVRTALCKRDRGYEDVTNSSNRRNARPDILRRQLRQQMRK